jgi:ABC-type multidrug transport system permease subunit
VLDDRSDREELRTRYHTLLQENRVLLPGVQIMVAFLVTVPFNSRFVELDRLGEVMWATALTSGCVAIVCLMTPTVFHRLGDRRRRSSRLVWAIRTQRGGILLFGASLVISVAFVLRFVSGVGSAAVVVAVIVLSMAWLWLVVPVHDAEAGNLGRSPSD